MKTLYLLNTRLITLFLLIFFSQCLFAQTDIFWVNVNGDWSDPINWRKDSGSPNLADIIPDEDYNAIIDQNSGLNASSVITIPPGSYSVNDLIITNLNAFDLLFDGTSVSDDVELNVYGNLELTENMDLIYSSSNYSHNRWRFVGANHHNIRTGYQDMLSVEFVTPGGIYSQEDHFTASGYVRMYAGTWNTNGRDVNSGWLYFRDSNPSNNPLLKIFNTGTSTINCDEWDSQLTYGSLKVNGKHIINTQKFTGSPIQNNGSPFEFYEIHLLEYPDATSLPIEDNNFECRGCIIETLTIEDTGETQLADRFSVNGKFTVVNQGSSLLFNSGNSRESEVTFNGSITTPEVVNCDDPRTIFAAVYNGDDPTIFIKDSGELTIEDAILEDIQTSGNADFNLSGGVLQGSSSGWNLINNPVPIEYYWQGIDGANGSWNNSSNWVLQNGSWNGCIPTITDNVNVTNDAKGNIRIPSPYNAKCNDFIWTNTKGLSLGLDGQSSDESALTVAGSFHLDETATIIPINSHEIYFSSATDNYIETRGVDLPEIRFSGDLGQWTLQDDLVCDRLTFAGGTLNTASQDVTTDYWNCIDENPKQFNFSNSHITVHGEMALSRSTYDNVTVNPGTSLIECEELTSTVTHLYDVQLNNATGQLMENYAYDFNTLILNGIGEVSTQHDMTLNDLVFLADGSSLALDISDDFTINGGIESMTSQAQPAILKSKTVGVRADIHKPVGNICALGHIEYTDINADMEGVFNAPDGINGGNTLGINYASGSGSTTGYWIGGSGEWDVKSNWSQISGGCPSNKNPNDFTNLIFNNDGFYEIYETITIPLKTDCQQMFFYNNESSVTLDIADKLSPTKFVVSGGDVSLTGDNLYVSGETKIETAGYLSTYMLDFRTEALNTVSGLLIIRNGSSVKVTE